MAQIQQQIVSLDGGLVLNKDPFTQPIGSALLLQNFEPSIKGGYRRMAGTNKYILKEFNDTNLGTTSKTGSDELLMTAILGNDVIAARGAVVGKATSTFLTITHTDAVTTFTVNDTSGFASSGTLFIKSEQIAYTGKTATTFTGVSRAQGGTSAAEYVKNDIISTNWTKIDEARTSAEKYTYARYNFSGTDKICIVDGVNPPASYDGTTYTLLNSTGFPTTIDSVAVHRNHMFFAKSTSQELTFSAPFNENDFTAANGAGSINVNDTIVAIQGFRDRLFIFCTDSIYALQGTSVADFVVVPVTTKIGCRDKHSVQEVAGDLIYLAPDGLRTIAGTTKIGDVELGTVSKAIQERIDALSFDNISSVTVREKSQYRLFFPNTAGNENNQLGILGTIKEGQQGGIGYQWGDIKGLKPACTDSFFIGAIEVVVHGGYDGFVYQQENGNTFHGTNIKSFYRSPDIIIGDAGIRKNFQRLISNYTTEGTLSAELRVRYDFDDFRVPQPAVYNITEGAGAATYGLATTVYGTAVYGASGTPLIRQPIEGSGFAVAIKIDEDTGSAPFVLNGFQLEFTPGVQR
jgi:hypothetical protein